MKIGDYCVTDSGQYWEVVRVYASPEDTPWSRLYEQHEAAGGDLKQVFPAVSLEPVCSVYDGASIRMIVPITDMFPTYVLVAREKGDAVKRSIAEADRVRLDNGEAVPY